MGNQRGLHSVTNLKTQTLFSIWWGVHIVTLEIDFKCTLKFNSHLMNHVRNSFFKQDFKLNCYSFYRFFKRMLFDIT